MDRTVPRTGSEEIELFMRTYYSLLRSSTDIQIRTLEEVHANMGSALHPDARSPIPDFSAFTYCGLRLPPCIIDVERVILGQSQEVFRQGGVGDVESWQEVSAHARRRRTFYDGQGTMASYIASRSDIDDLLPMLTAFQIEWNKLHRLLGGSQVRAFLQDPQDDGEGLAVLAHGMGVEPAELERVRTAWGEDFWPMMRAVAEKPKRLRVRLLASSLNDYRRATQLWWENVVTALPTILERPVYFVSSNPHSMVNLYTGFALRQEKELLRLLKKPGHRDLMAEWEDIQARHVPSSRENFLYYALKKITAMPEGEKMNKARAEAEAACGVWRVPCTHGFDVETQVIDLAKLQPTGLDPRLCCPDVDLLAQSDACLVNIDYPLGMAAYEILSYVATRVGGVLGVYILGKAATLNGAVGDVMIPSVLHDEQSHNTYMFDNSLKASDIEGWLVYGTVLDNQKGVSVRGTFLQTPRYMDVFYREGYTVIEMEAGPYLSAVYEMYRPQRHPSNEIVNLYGLPFDLGVVHYASDTPLSKGGSLGAGSLSYFGMDPTYASSVAIWRQVLALEVERMRQALAGQET